MNIRNLGWKWSLVVLVPLLVIGLSLRLAEPVRAQGSNDVWITHWPGSIDVSGLSKLDVAVTQGSESPFTVRLDQGRRRDSQCALREPSLETAQPSRLTPRRYTWSRAVRSSCLTR